MVASICRSLQNDPSGVHPLMMASATVTPFLNGLRPGDDSMSTIEARFDLWVDDRIPAAEGDTIPDAEVRIGELHEIRGAGRPRKDEEKSSSADRGVVHQVAVRMADDIFATAADEPAASAWLPLPWADRPPPRATSAAATQSPITTGWQMRHSGEADDDRGSGPAPARADR
jgi:hypothetical protein